MFGFWTLLGFFCVQAAPPNDPLVFVMIPRSQTTSFISHWTTENMVCHHRVMVCHHRVMVCHHRVAVHYECQCSLIPHPSVQLDEESVDGFSTSVVETFWIWSVFVSFFNVLKDVACLWNAINLRKLLKECKIVDFSMSAGVPQVKYFVFSINVPSELCASMAFAHPP